MNAPFALDHTSDPQLLLAGAIAKFRYDPLGFVLFVFPWGEPGSPLAREKGPKRWQADFLEEVGREAEKRNFDGVTTVDPLLFSTASGHGIGKSALVAWLILWIMSTRPMARGLVTATTGMQLQTRTWAELAKWWRLSINKDWFDIQSSMGNLAFFHKAYKENWRFDGQTNSKENADAFQGMHNKNSSTVYIFDEASGVEDEIFKVREGGLVDGEPMVFDFGNPIRNTGRFYENMKGKYAHAYIRRQIDSRTVENLDAATLRHFERMEKDYGPDSDTFKSRVRGMFPDAGENQFIPGSLYDLAIDVEYATLPSDPVVIGVDPAYYGPDRAVIYVRRGRDAMSDNVWDEQILAECSTVELASAVARTHERVNADLINIDIGGPGPGVYDHLVQVLGFTNVTPVNFAGQARRKDDYANRRAEIWDGMKAYLEEGAMLPAPEDHEAVEHLREELTTPLYEYNRKGQLVIESKDLIKKRLPDGVSPDIADALALTFAEPVNTAGRAGFQGAPTRLSDYDPLENF